MVPHNEADLAFEKFKQLRRTNSTFLTSNHEWTESDTRSKFIDPIFKDVLGWREADIIREEPSIAGFADYVLGAEFAYLHIEAKRLTPRFHINSVGETRRLKLDGPHLLGKKLVAPFINQAAKYSSDLGTDFAVVTNGTQFILFRTRVPGRKWTTGHALVWHSLNDIEQDFAAFYDALSAERVRAGGLIQLFETVEGFTRPLYTPLDFVYNPDHELLRNKYWNRMSSIIGPLLTDTPEDPDLELKVLQYCYVDTHLSNEASENLSLVLANANVVNLRIGQQGRTGFDHSIDEDTKNFSPRTYILTGGVGSGKTTYLKRFARVANVDFIRRYCVWLHVDYLVAGAVPADPKAELRKFTYPTLRALLERDHQDLLPQNGESTRKLFEPRIREAEKTTLYGVEVNSPSWKEKVGVIVDNLYRNDEAFVRAVLAAGINRGLRIVVVLDNTDQLGEEFQQAIFLFSQRLARDLKAICIVSLREEKFFAAHRRGIFDAFGDRRFHIGSPTLSEVIRRRLEYGLVLLDQLQSNVLEESERATLRVIVETLIRSASHQNGNIVRMLAAASTGNMRHALDMFRQFMSSGNTDIDKIVRIVKASGSYSVPFHEFAKSAILGQRKYFRGSATHFLNLFARAPTPAASHLTAARVLARLDAILDVASIHGDGFANTQQLLLEYRTAFGIADDFIYRAGELLRHGLLESEPPRAPDILETEALRISPSGSYYWRFLVRSFAYLDLVYIDTPVFDKPLAQNLASLADQTNLEARFLRVQTYLDFLDFVEREDLAKIGQHGGLYSDSLITGIREQIESEIAVIRQKNNM